MAEQTFNLDRILDEAYQLYMPQIREEIGVLARMVQPSSDKPITIVEIGTKFGGTFYIWNSINSHPDALNISIDMSDGGIHGGIPDAEMDKRDLYFHERFNNCKFIRGNSHDEATLDKLKDLVGTSEPFIDFLFIDGDHRYDGVAQDFKMYSPLVKAGGTIAFHDIVISERHHKRNVFVGEFWNDLINSNGFKDAYFPMELCLENEDWGGIGLLTKKPTKELLRDFLQ